MALQFYFFPFFYFFLFSSGTYYFFPQAWRVHSPTVLPLAKKSNLGQTPKKLAYILIHYPFYSKIRPILRTPLVFSEPTENNL